MRPPPSFAGVLAALTLLPVGAAALADERSAPGVGLLHAPFLEMFATQALPEPEPQSAPEPVSPPARVATVEVAATAPVSVPFSAAPAAHPLVASAAQADDDNDEIRHISLDGLTLSDAVGIAIAHHPDVSRANAEVSQRTAEVDVAKTAWYPKIDYGVKPGYGRSYTVANTGNSGAVRTSVGVNQLVYDFGVTPSRIKAADATLEQSGYELADTIETVAYNTATTYIELAAAQDRIAAAQHQVEALKATRDKIVDRVRAGLSVSSDQNLADLSIMRAEAEVEQANTKRDVATAKLAELIGVRPQSVASLANAVSLVDGLGGPGEDVDQRPSVMAASAAVHAADAKVDVARGSRYPAIGVGAARTVSTGPASALNDTWFGLAVSGSFNLGDLGKRQVDAAQAALTASRDKLENERLVTRSALRSAQTEATGAAQRMASYDKIIGLARVSRDLYWQEYILNKRTLTDVLNPERDIYQSEVEWINALADGTVARIRTYVAVGRFVRQLRDREENKHG